MTRQFNWKCWHWPWHRSYFDRDYKIYAHFAGFGLFQYHWWSSKP